MIYKSLLKGAMLGLCYGWKHRKGNARCLKESIKNLTCI
jgi:hypothetical protein